MLTRGHPVKQKVTVTAAWRLLFILDSDDVRRNVLSRYLNDSHTVIPLASIDELAGRWPEEGCIMVADEAGMREQCLEAMRGDGVCLPVICYQNQPTTAQVFSAFSDGACGYCALPITSTDLQSELCSSWLRFTATRTARERKSRAAMLMAGLTVREREVLGHLLDGLCSKASARRLEISPRTVELHRSNLLAKLEAKSLLGAAITAMEAEQLDELASEQPDSPLTTLTLPFPFPTD